MRGEGSIAMSLQRGQRADLSGIAGGIRTLVGMGSDPWIHELVGMERGPHAWGSARWLGWDGFELK